MSCGGSDGVDTQALEEYYARVEAIEAEQQQRVDEAQEVIAAVSANSGSFEEQRQATEDFLRFAATDIEALLQGFRDIDPPDEVEEPHNRTIEFFEVVMTSTESVIPEVEQASSLDGLTEILAEYVASIEPLEEPCRELEQIAADHDIEADLDCDVDG